jgi:hypothetical protein
MDAYFYGSAKQVSESHRVFLRQDYSVHFRWNFKGTVTYVLVPTLVPRGMPKFTGKFCTFHQIQSFSTFTGFHVEWRN